MLNRISEIRVRTVLKALIVPLMYVSYILSSIWLLIGDPILDALFVFLVVFIIPVIFWILIDKILPDGTSTIHIIVFLRDRKEHFVYFIGTFLVYWLILFPLLTSPLVPRGDEPSHVARIIYTSVLIAFRGRVNPVLIGVAIIVTLLVGSLLLTFIASPGKESRLDRAITFLTSMKVRSFLLLCVAIVFSYQSYQSYLWTVNETYVSRFGPLHPIVFSLPHLLFGFTDLTIILWRSLNVGLMVLTAVFIRATTKVILKKLISRDKQSRIIGILSSFAGWIFLLFPPTVEFSSQIWLSSGVSLFFTMSFFFLVKLLNSNDNKKHGLYLILLSLSLGIGSLWKRVILVEAAAIYLFLLLFYLFNRPINKKGIANTIMSGVLYALIFGPWFMVVQLGGTVERSYILNIEYLLPPHLWDYLLRFDTQMGFVFGVSAYVSLAILFLFSLYKRERSTLSMVPIFAIWYVFFNLDDGWPHDVDRFFIPVLSLMVISFIVVVGLISTKALEHIQKSSNNLTNHRETPMKLNSTNLLPLMVLILLFSTIGFGMAETSIEASGFISSQYQTRYVPYDSAAEYIHSIIQGNYSELYSRFGPSSLTFYLMRYGNYPLTTAGLGVTWSPEPDNTTPAAFVDYLKSMHIRALALPSPGLIGASYLPGFIAQELITNWTSYGIHSMREFTLREQSFYVWEIVY